MELRKLAGPETGLLSDAFAVDWEANGIDFYEDVVFGTGGGHDILMDLMIPRKSAGTARPALLWLHGGSWSIPQCDKKYRPSDALIQLCNLGFVCATITYRLVIEAPFPAPIEDCNCAVRFLKAHSKQLGIDPDRIGIWGESAGGQLAALVGVSYNNPRLAGNGGWNEYSSEVRAVCDWYCGGDMTHFGAAEAPEVQQRAAELGIRLSGMDRPHGENPGAQGAFSDFGRMMFGKAPIEAPQLSMDISPIFYVKEEKLPPFLLMHGDCDNLVPLDFSYNFYDALVANGHEASLLLVARQGHGYFKGQEYWDIPINFFRKHLMGDAPAERV